MRGIFIKTKANEYLAFCSLQKQNNFSVLSLHEGSSTAGQPRLAIEPNLRGSFHSEQWQISGMNDNSPADALEH